MRWRCCKYEKKGWEIDAQIGKQVIQVLCRCLGMLLKFTWKFIGRFVIAKFNRRCCCKYNWSLNHPRSLQSIIFLYIYINTNMLCPRVISHQYLYIYIYIYVSLSITYNTSIIRSFTIYDMYKYLQKYWVGTPNRLIRKWTTIQKVDRWRARILMAPNELSSYES